MSSDALKAIIFAINSPQAQAYFNSWSFTDFFFFFKIVLAFYGNTYLPCVFTATVLGLFFTFSYW